MQLLGFGRPYLPGACRLVTSEAQRLGRSFIRAFIEYITATRIYLCTKELYPQAVFRKLRRRILCLSNFVGALCDS